MKLKLKPISRLTIVFILAVTIPGAILSYLSIRNITNLQELMERRVLEEEEKIAELVYLNFGEKLNVIRSDFLANSLAIEENKYAMIRYADTLEYVGNPFVMNMDGEFLWPILNEPAVRQRQASSNAFNTNFTVAERFEFAQNNNTQALRRYQRALAYATTETDSAQAINAIARVYSKSGDTENALDNYSLLVYGYSNVYDRNGLSYLLYAIPQVLKLSDSSNANLVLNKLIFVTSGMVSGSIAVTSDASLIIDNISSWLSDYYGPKHKEKNEVESYLEEIRKRISFLQDNGELLKNYILAGKRVESLSLEENVYAIKGSSDYANESIIIIESEQDLILGFTVNLDSLAEYAARVDVPPGYRFSYELEITPANMNPVSQDQGLVMMTNLSPLTPEKSVRVKLKDEHTLKKQIYRTSWIYGVAIILLIGGMILGVFLILRDIDRERHLSRLRSEFVSNVTHELKTPLTSIHMFAESILLDRVKNTSDQKEYLGIILKETDRLKRLINNILDFSKREKGKLVYHFDEVDISALVRSAVSDLDYWTKEKQFEVRTEIQDGIIGHADQDALKQAVINLMSNAIKYSGDNKEIFVKVWRNEKLIFIEVEDKGIGIAEDKQDLIFEKFYRIESSDAPENTGTGLGLTVVKDILEAHNGSITVTSTPGQGSTFTIVLNA